MLTQENRTPDVRFTKFKHCERQTYPAHQLKCSPTLSILQYFLIWFSHWLDDHISTASFIKANIMTVWPSAATRHIVCNPSLQLHILWVYIFWPLNPVCSVHPWEHDHTTSVWTVKGEQRQASLHTRLHMECPERLLLGSCWVGTLQWIMPTPKTS